MTAKDFIRSNIPAYLVDDSIIASNLEKKGTSVDAVYTESDTETKKKIELAYADCLMYVLRLPNSISQGGFSMSNIDKDFYMSELENIFGAYDMLDELLTKKPDITNAGEWQ